jgi:hypothetical protein
MASDDVRAMLGELVIGGDEPAEQPDLTEFVTPEPEEKKDERAKQPKEDLAALLRELVKADPSEIPPEDFSTTVASGRKRAVKAWRIPEGKQCEWAGLAKAGGGVIPIVGCRIEDQHKAKNIHHGPDKSTANNERSNIHMVCSSCHNRWHSINDKFYGIRPEDNGTYLPLPEYGEAQAHDSQSQATEEDYRRSDEYWSGVRVKKAQVEIG